MAVYRDELGGEAATSITHLAGNHFVDYDDEGVERESDTPRMLLVRARRAVKALVARGLLEDAGEVVSKTPAETFPVPGRYYTKGYTRLCRAYRLTESGRVLAGRLKGVRDAEYAAWRAANPENAAVLDAIEGRVNEAQEDYSKASKAV